MAANSGGMRQTGDEFQALPGESLRRAASSKCDSWCVGRERDRHRVGTPALASGPASGMGGVQKGGRTQEGLDSVAGGVDLDAANLSNTKLDAADLHDAKLRRANLGGAALRRANLGHAELIKWRQSLRRGLDRIKSFDG
jgi:uncharacterized protein YjbI with pentapeptide repeats